MSVFEVILGVKVPKTLENDVGEHMDVADTDKGMCQMPR